MRDVTLSGMKRAKKPQYQLFHCSCNFPVIYDHDTSSSLQRLLTSANQDTKAYYIGNNGLTLFNFAPTQFQNLMAQATPASGLLHFAGSDRTINSIVLLSNGISFAIQIVVFLILGSYADFGSWRPNILIVLSLVA